MPNKIDIVGHTFGRLTVLSDIPSLKRTNRSVSCLCKCGNKIVVIANALRRGTTKSCGCIKKEFPNHIIHNLSKTPEWKIWTNIKQRCENPTNQAYEDYGGRGIKLFPAWQNDFKAFYEYVGPRPTVKHSVDRINNNGHYEPGNVRWATKKQQTRNARSNRLLAFNGEICTIAEWAERNDIRYQTLWTRIDNGWSTSRALTQPVGYSRRHRSYFGAGDVAG